MIQAPTLQPPSPLRLGRKQLKRPQDNKTGLSWLVRNQNTILQTRNLQLEGENKHLRDFNESLKAELSSLLADRRTPEAPSQDKQDTLADHQLLDVHLQIARLEVENAKSHQRQSEHII